MGRYLMRLERVVAGAVRHGDVRLPPRERNRARAAHDALAAILEDAPAVRDLLAAAGTAEAGSPLHVETHLLAYTLDTVAAVRDWLVAGLAPVPEREPAERALAALVAAVEHIPGGPASVTGTPGRYDLEALTAAQAGMLRARNDPEPRPPDPDAA